MPPQSRPPETLLAGDSAEVKEFAIEAFVLMPDGKIRSIRLLAQAKGEQADTLQIIATQKECRLLSIQVSAAPYQVYEQ